MYKEYQPYGVLTLETTVDQHDGISRQRISLKGYRYWSSDVGGISTIAVTSKAGLGELSSLIQCGARSWELLWC